MTQADGGQHQLRRPRWRRWLLVRVPVAVLILTAGLLVAAEVIAGQLGCGSVDPTDPANYSEVSILNNTTATVRIDDCEGAYCGADLPARLAPGQRLSDDAACGVSGADMTSWRVSAEPGPVLGYIAVRTPRKHDGLVFPVSRASADRKTPTSPA